MDTESIIKELIENHSENDVLAYCTSELVSKHNLVTRALGSKNYEKAAGVIGESSFALGVLATLNAKRNGKNKDITVA